MRRLAVVSLAIAACTPASPASKTEVGADAGRVVEGALSTPVPPPRGRVQIVTAAPDSEMLSLVRTERLKAKAESRVLVVYVSATWCAPCKKFKQELESGRLDERLGKVTLLAFDADRDIDRLGAAGYVFRFVPFVALPGPDGRPSDVQEATGSGGQAWRELLGRLDAWQRNVPAKP